MARVFPRRAAKTAAAAMARGALPIPVLNGPRVPDVPFLLGALLPVAGAKAAPNSALGFLTGHRYRPKWGRVVDQGTSLPVSNASVTLLDEAGKPRQTIRTKADGNFVFLVPPGQYHLSAARSGHDMEKHPKNIALLPGELLYAGEPFTVQAASREGETLTPPVVVAMKAREKRRALAVRPALQQLSFRARAAHAQVALPLLLVSAGLNSVVLLQQPTPFLVASEIFYGVLLSMELLLSRAFRRAIGRLRDAVKHTPVSLAIVRLVEERTGRIAGTLVSSSGGAFLLSARPGAYRLSAAHPKYESHEERIQVRGGVPGLGRVTVRLQPRSGATAAS